MSNLGFEVGFAYGYVLNPINTVINKSGNVFNWSEIFGVYSIDGNDEFETGEFKYVDILDSEKSISIITE